MKTHPLWVDSYLRILGLSQESPSLAFLNKIVQAHITTFPFENISKILQINENSQATPPIPSVELFLSDYERFGFGGTCFTLNWHLKNLLTNLGYVCHLVMLSHQHMAIIVLLPTPKGIEQIYVDSGAAGPLFRPISLSNHSDEHVLSFGEEQIVISPRISKSIYRYTRYHNNAVQGDPLYFDIDQPCTMNDFVPVIEASFESKMPFISTIRCHIWGSNLHYYSSLKNNRLSIVYQDGMKIVRNLNTIQELASAAQILFGIHQFYVTLACDRLNELGTCIFPEVS